MFFCFKVRSMEVSSLGSLNPGTIIGCGKRKRYIRYDNIVEDDGVTYCEQVVSVSAVLDGGNVGASHSYERRIIRPIPPILEIVEHDLQFGLCVDVDYEEAWWEGVIFDHDNEIEERNIFFPDLGDEMKIRIQQLRITQDWDEVSDSWKRRGKWAFLELIEEIASESYIPVSIKQIYYDVRKRDDFFDRIKDWTCNIKDLWREPIMEIINHYTDLTISEILHVLDLPTSLLEKTTEKHESADNVEANMTKQESKIGLKTKANVESNVEHVSRVTVALSSSSVKDAVVEPEICPQAVVKYYLSATENCASDKKKWRLKAKKHLLAEGWVLKYRNKNKTRAVYKSPQNQCLKKLKDACRVYLEATIPRWTIAGMRTLNVSSINVEGVDSDNIMKCVTKIFQKDPEFNVRDTLLATASRSNRNTSRHRHMEMSDPNNFHQKPQNVISWLVEKNKVVPRSKVYYQGNRGRDPAVAEGRITRDGIKCSCCHNIYGINGFASHASGSSDLSPSGNIFLKDGRSLLDCQREVMYDDRTSETTEKPSNDFDKDKNDDICSICRYGGDIILCDKCPSAFHKECIGLKDIPDGHWFCPLCHCTICRKIATKSTEDGRFLTCTQCQLKYHVGCLTNRGADQHLEQWFCGINCERMYVGLRELLGKAISVGEKNLSWTLLKFENTHSSDIGNTTNEFLIECYSKLSVAALAMHECFVPQQNPLSRRDITVDIKFSRW
ncbi:putative histone acetyltransferase chromatin regulator PHD family [Lupinus albus]|uniref:Putative histone acetyltransferase chromatin regulator PHD family n=1 Tax=Lupinus albus TaxID=3870 RepID=A0A6A4NHP1_LUPAL|nr:putative histone acetyltransferase chromatin regulator PHD family [Lupinus albus]